MRKVICAETRLRSERLLMSDKARLQAYKTFSRIVGGAYSNLIDIGNGLEGLDRSFAEAIVLGSVERKITLQFVVDKFISKDTKPEIVHLLMTGVYQILFMDRVPDSAACDETVSIAKETFGKNTSSFVNAVMRNVCRKKSEVLNEIDNAEGYIKFSANKELFKLIKGQYPDNCDRIFDAFFNRQIVYLRVNNLNSSSEEVANLTSGKALDEKRVVCESAAKAIEHIEKGLFYIQGAASQEAVNLLNALPGETVIDVCACPGGKSLGAAIDMNNRGRIFSFDIHEKKLPLIEKSAKKLGISIITTEKHDARIPKNELFGIADKVICDVPCSGTGVMGTKPEIKYKSPDDFNALYVTQRAIIRAASKYLKVGGEMIYSTCSINKIENEETVIDFINENNNFKLIYEKTFLPYEEENEGFYIAKIKREK